MKLLRLLFSVIYMAMLGWAPSAAGALLNGQVGMMGKATLDGPLASATAISSFHRARVGYGTGDFSVSEGVFAGTPVSFTPFSFVEPLGGPIRLWEFVSEGRLYAFDLHEWEFECFEFGENSFMDLSGFGYASVDGVRTTAGEFCFTTQQCTESTEVVVTWSAETIMRPVPELGKAWIYLLFGLLSIEVFRRSGHIPGNSRLVSR